MSADVIVVGAGPAGVSAALWARRLGLACDLIEADSRPGGQLHLIHVPLRDLAGAAEGAGPAVAASFAAQLARAGIAPHLDAAAVGLDAGGGEARATVVAADGRRFSGAAVVVATGARPRRLEVPGEREFEGRGVSTSATRDRGGFAAKPVFVVGGGDAAFENALLLAEVGCTVTLLVRGVPRARAEFRERVAKEPRIEVIEQARVVAILGGERVERVGFESRAGAVERPVAGIVIKVGMMPNTEWCGSAVDLDPAGYVVVDEGLRASAPRVWAAGDVVRPPRASLAAAIGHGALALAEIFKMVRA